MTEDKYAVLPRSVGDNDDDLSEEESEDEENDNEENVKKSEKVKKTEVEKPAKKVKLPPRNITKLSAPKYNVGLGGRNINLDYNNSILIPNTGANEVGNNKIHANKLRKDVPFYKKKWFKVVSTIVITIFCSLIIVWLTIKLYKRYYLMQNDPIDSVMRKDKNQMEKEREDELKRLQDNEKHADKLFNDDIYDNDSRGKKKSISGGGKRKMLKRDARGRFVRRN